MNEDTANRTIADRYLIQKSLGQGGMGAVYRAFDRSENRDVAVKEVHFKATDFPVEFLHRKFLEEASMLARLRHPRIPRIWDSFVEGECGFIIMEFIQGENLDALVENRLKQGGAALSCDEAVDYALQICSILSYLHAQSPTPIVHRDIKPQNIVLRRSEVVLLDFGMALPLSPDSEGTRTTVGTLGYAPPEQWEGEAEPRSDVYGLGATLYYLLSGTDPVPLKVCSPRQVQPRLPTALSAIVEKATQQKPQDRFDSIAAMEAALRLVQEARPGGRGRAWYVLFVLILLAAVCLWCFWGAWR